MSLHTDGQHSINEHRALNSRRSVLSYDKETDTIHCMIHGQDRSYSLILSDLGWIKICSTCGESWFAEVLSALSDNPDLVCHRDGCKTVCPVESTCIWCKKTYCRVHLPDTYLCVDCEENETEHRHFRGN